MSKSPAFQMYPNDFLGSGKVAAMDLEQTGAYTLLLCYDWNEVGLPNDTKCLARWIRVSERKFEKLWKQIKSNFELKNGRWYNPRLERERAKQAANREKKQDAAAARWSTRNAPAYAGAHPRADAPAMQTQSSSIASPSASPSAASKREHLKSGAKGKTISANGASAAPAEMLPEQAARLLDVFYSADANRRTAVARQLHQSLNGEGARLGRGVRVRAKDISHLDRCCAAVIADPPDNPDVAIRWVLLKLQDEEKDERGRYPGEANVEREKAAIAKDNAYDRARRAAANEWAKEHETEFEQLEQAAFVNCSVKGTSGDIVRNSWLLQEISTRTSFPTFEEWEAGRARAKAEQ